MAALNKTYGFAGFKRVITAAASLVLSLLTGFAQPGRGKPEKPNIIFILTDDQRWNALGFAGNCYIHTPEMDRLAASGVYFDHAIATTPICSASRASLLTGLHERTHKYTFQTGPVPERFMRDAYPAVLRQNGYYTGFYGKLGVKCDRPEQLFDVYDDYDRNNKFKDRRGYFYKTIGNDTVHLTTYTGSQAVEFLRNAPKDKPFCLSLSFSAPHAHDQAPEQYFWEPSMDTLYSKTVFPQPELADDRYFNALPREVREGESRTRWRWRFDEAGKYQNSIRGYYRMISGVDAQINAIRAELKRLGMDQNTILIMMADNGYFLGDRQIADKWLMYDTSIRVPLIIYDPRNGAAGRISDIAANIDIPATILDFAGVRRPAGWQGQSLKGLAEGRAKRLGRDTVLIEHLWETPIIPPSEGVRTAGWKYFRYVNDKNREELYDLAKDPEEKYDLARDEAARETLARLRQACDRLIEARKDRAWDSIRALDVNTGSLPVRLTWEVSPLASSQRAYQVLVSGSSENLEKNIGELWNSGRVEGGAGSGAAYEGALLRPGQSYYWKVRVWDQDNRLTEYSRPARLIYKPANEGSKPRVVILTDISSLKTRYMEPDDGQSMIRLMLYANSLDIEGLIATSNMKHALVTRPDLIHQVIDAYERVQPNLAKHDPAYPDAGELRAVVKSGQPKATPRAAVQTFIGEGMDTEGSDWLIKIVDSDDPRPVWICIWGGAADLAQALWKIRKTRSKDETDSFVDRLRIRAITDQDSTIGWIKKQFPELHHVYGQKYFRGMYRGGDTSLTDSLWVARNIHQPDNPLGMLYPNYWGGDVFAEGPGSVKGIKEGDTPSYLALIPNGFNIADRPELGSWGGLFSKVDANNFNEKVDSVASYQTDKTPYMASVYRWRQDWQDDFLARLRWCYLPFEKANHYPFLEVNGDKTAGIMESVVRKGQSVSFDAGKSTDPDGGKLSFHWQVYPKTATGTVSLHGTDSARLTISAAADAKPQTIPLLLTVKDDGSPALRRYKRILVHIR